jgi:UDP-N-acetylmuramyl pentapeptide synthase
MELALRDFFDTTLPGQRIIVVGDMLEVGTTELQAHYDILILIAKLKDAADSVLCIGPRFSQYKNGFPFRFFDLSIEAAPFFNTLPLDGKKVFLKGSRGIKVEEIL